jgi:dipeptidyl aminopeptidase/acylaminoacyl peptidase
MDPTNIGFLKWKDSYETREAHLAKTIKKENALFLSQFDESQLDTLMKINEDYHIASVPEIIWKYPLKSPKIYLQPPRLNRGWQWTWDEKKPWKEVSSLNISEDGKTVAIIYSEDTDYKLSVKTEESSWTYRNLVGSDIGIIGECIYFIEGDKPLQYTRVVSLDLRTGRNKRVLYVESDLQKEIDLVCCEGRALFLTTYRAGYNTLYQVRVNGELNQLSPRGVSFFPVGRSGTEPIYFVREGSFSAPWKLVGCNWKLNSRISADGIEFCSVSAKILITKFYGVRTIWKMSSGDPVPIYRGVFEITEFTKFYGWLYGNYKTLWAIKPGSAQFEFDVNSTIIERPAIKYGSLPESGIAISSDGLPVRWTLLRPVGKPRGLICTAYGAYGLPTNINSTRWRIWIDAGWAISFLFIRGGGDGNEIWADIGRLGGKKRALDDAEACIHELQRITKVSSKNTVIFGRSAGGLIVGGLAARWPQGKLFSIIYTEVPYVDLLKTAANPKLPLTVYEYEEFANPRAGLAEFEEALAISPIHQLGPEGAPGVRVLCRSGIHDIQVYPYESLKWIEALRGGRKDTTKIVYIDNDGHHSMKMYKEYTIDFLIINKWINV